MTQLGATGPGTGESSRWIGVHVLGHRSLPGQQSVGAESARWFLPQDRRPEKSR